MRKRSKAWSERLNVPKRSRTKRSPFEGDKETTD